MRIPLDYYRILGLPIQATTEQLKQAHRDRTLQLPRREYSETAIESRKSLIDEAYESLSDPEKRRIYDAQFLARTYTPGGTDTFLSENAGTVESELNPRLGEEALRSLASNDAPTPPLESHTPSIEIDESQLVGALLVLLELGEYELAIRLGRPFVTNGSANIQNGRYGDPDRVREDVVLTLSLACLELGREQWQQNQYENAAESLSTGQELLLQESLFPVIQAELQSDLYKLRPYRILELLARPLDQTMARRQGIHLLKAMLHDRGGIEGTGDDLSGLSTDDFLRFIQQLRGYLTVAEQQDIFETEARRPSAAATYLAVYALLARGFSFHQPALIRRAKQLLLQVAVRQDVHLEQAVCALLLGQAEEADHALELSQEYEPLAFIREHSQDSPDLLPGLCLYAERWLREDVFTHFRDLANQQSALKDYFADPQVQSFLETMPMTPPQFSQPVRTPARASTQVERVSLATDASMPPLQTPAAAYYQPSSTTAFRQPPPIIPEPEETAGSKDVGLSVAERVSQLSPEGQLKSNGAYAPTPPPAHNGHRPSAAVAPPTKPTPDPVRRSPSSSPRWGRLLSVVVLGLLAAGTLGFVTVRALGWLGSLLTGPKLQRPVLDIGLTTPPVSIPTPAPPEAQISVEDIAERTITDWLSAKREAMSDRYNSADLAETLVDPALTDWQNRALGAEQGNWYYSYQHDVEILAVEPDDPTADALTVEAQVHEVGEFYELGVRNNTNSYDSELTMEYELVRQDGDWFVQDMIEINE